MSYRIIYKSYIHNIYMIIIESLLINININLYIYGLEEQTKSTNFIYRSRLKT